MEDTNIIDVDCEKPKHQTRDNVFYELTIPNVIGGSVTRSVYASSYLEGSSIVLTAVPRTGYKFISWTDDIDGSTNPLLVIMNSNMTKKAIFSIIQFELIINTADGGTFTKVPVGDIVDDKTLFKYGSNVTLTATPTSGYKFIGWFGTVNSKNLKFIITMNKNITLTPTFELIEYKLITNVIGDGQVTRSPDGEKYKPTDTIIVTAVPDFGNTFVNWINASKKVISTNPIISNLKLNADLTITATFDITRFKLTISSTPNLGGTIRKSSNGIVINNKNYYLPGSKVTLTAVPNFKYEFKRWEGTFKGDDLITDNPLSIPIDYDIALKAIFSTIQYELKFNIIGDGQISRNPKGNVVDDKILYSTGTRVLLTTVPDSGWEFSRWISGVTSNTKTASLIIKSNSIINVEFRLMQCEIIINIVENGMVEIDPIVAPHPVSHKMLYNYRTSVKLTAIPGKDYQFSNWVNTYGTQISPMDELSPVTTTTIVSNRTITCIFKVVEYELEVIYEGNNGIIYYFPKGTIVNNKMLYPLNTLVRMTVVPDSKYQFDGWTGIGVLNSKNNPIEINMNRDISITANISLKRFMLDVKWDNYGIVKVSPITEMMDGKYLFAIGEYITLEPIANDSYKFYGWSGDNTSDDDPLKFIISKDMAIYGNFDLIQFELKLNYDEDCTVERNPPGRFVNGKLMYVPQTTIYLTAIAGVGHFFVHWEGTSHNIYTTNSQLPHFELTSKREFTAVFELIPYDLVVICDPPLSCTIVQSPLPVIRDGQPKYLYGTPVNLTITMNFGFLFDNWTGTHINDTSNKSIDLIVTCNVSQVANSTIAYQLLVTKDIGGSVSQDKIGDFVDGKEMFRTGTPILLIATPLDGYRVVGWEGTNVGELTKYDIDIIIDKTTIQNANFIVSYQLILNVTDGGTVERSSEGILDHDRIMYDENPTITFTPIAEDGYRFYSFVGNDIATYYGDIDAYYGPTPKAYTIDHHITLEASFIKIFELIATSESNGSITIFPAGTIVNGKRMYDDGTIVTLIAFPNDLYELEEWDGTDVYSTREIEITMNQAITQTAKYIQTYWDLIVNITGNGTCDYSPVYKTINNRKMYTIGTEVTLTAQESGTYVFTGWEDETFEPLTITMDQQRIIEMEFIAVVKISFYDPSCLIKYSQESIPNGTVDIECGDTYVIQGELCVPQNTYFNIIIKPDDNYRISSWAIYSQYYGWLRPNLTNTINYQLYSYSYYIYVCVEFKRSYSLTIIQVTGGNVTFTPAGTNINNKRYFNPDEYVYLTSNAVSGYRCDGWLINDVDTDAELSISYTLCMTSNMVIEAKYTQSYKITVVNATNGGSFTYAFTPTPTYVDDLIYYVSDTSVKIDITVDSNYLIDYITVDGVGVFDSTTATFTLTRDTIIYVYSTAAYRITLLKDGTGTGTFTTSPPLITVNNLTYYPVNQYYTISAFADEGCVFSHFYHTVHGNYAGSASDTWGVLRCHWNNIVITAFFEKVFKLTCVVSGGSSVTINLSPAPNFNIGGYKYYITGTNVTLSLTNIYVSTNRVESWSDDPGSKASQRTIRMTADFDITVNVVRQAAPLKHPVSYGTAVWSPEPNATNGYYQYYDYGTDITVTATANTGYEFSRFYYSGVSLYSNPVTFSAIANTWFYTYFQRI